MMGYHVVQEDYSLPPLPQVDVAENIDDAKNFSEVVKAMMDAGYLEASEMGVVLTEKWYGKLDKFVKDALADAVIKSTSEGFDVSGICCEKKTAILFSYQILKSLGVATENSEFGYDAPPPEAISDAEVKSAEQNGAKGGVNTDKMSPSGISDGEVTSATHKSMEVKKHEGKKEDANKNEDEHEEEHEGDEEDTKKAVDPIINITFKGLADARAWNNPDPDKYQIVPTNFWEKNKYGRNKAYIVKEKQPRKVTGAHGNKLV
jgi:hypothetical protein